jgi:hypothetical protein
LKNTAAPVHLSRRKFDLVEGNPVEPLLARYANLYLADGGTIALVLPSAMADISPLLAELASTAPSLRARVVDLQDTGPPAGPSRRLVVATQRGMG